MTNSAIIQQCSLSHVEQYGIIYADAFSGEPWKDHWTVDDATTHVREILDCKQAFGLEYVKDGQVITKVSEVMAHSHHLTLNGY